MWMRGICLMLKLRVRLLGVDLRPLRLLMLLLSGLRVLRLVMLSQWLLGMRSRWWARLLRLLLLWMLLLLLLLLLLLRRMLLLLLLCVLLGLLISESRCGLLRLSSFDLYTWFLLDSIL